MNLFFGRKFYSLIAIFMLLSGAWIYADSSRSPDGADAVPDLYAPNLAGPGAFVTTTGGAPASAINPAQGGTASQMIFDLGYLAIASFNKPDERYMQSAELGALIPLDFGVFGGSIRIIGGKPEKYFSGFPIETTFGGNIFAAKEIQPGMSVGAGFNFGFGAEWTLSADFGIHHKIGKIGPLENFTWAFALRSVGKSYYPTWLTPTAGVSFDFLHIQREGKPDPLRMGTSADLSLPSLFYPPEFNVIFKTGINMTIAELVTISASWPGASGFNLRELGSKKIPFQPIPSIGVGVRFSLPSAGRPNPAERHPTDGSLRIDAAIKPLYDSSTALGSGVTWYVGQPYVAEKPSSEPETSAAPITLSVNPPFFSPDNDGIDDELLIRVAVVDAFPIAKWSLEILEPEPPYNLFRHVEGRGLPPDLLIWNGKSDSGELVQSATNYPYTFTVEDIHGNVATAEGKINVGILVMREGDRYRIQIPSIIFRGDHSDFIGLEQAIINNNNSILENIAVILNNYSDYNILVEGHANATQPAGPARDREQAELITLSNDRARAVMDILARNGVARNRMSSVGVGASRPIIPYEDRLNWWKNRRVEFYLIK